MWRRPLPPGASTHKDVRYLDIHEDDEIDEPVLASWIRQASQLPGWEPKNAFASSVAIEVAGGRAS
jgi:hypothetical protein